MSLHVVHICGVCSLSVKEKKTTPGTTRKRTSDNEEKTTAEQYTEQRASDKTNTYPIATATHISQAHSVQLNYPRSANSVGPFLECPHHTYHPPTLPKIFFCPSCSTTIWARTKCNLRHFVHMHLLLWHCHMCRSMFFRHWCNIRFCCRRRTKHKWRLLCISFHPRVWHRHRRF